jgi:hypothetical protein
MLPQHFELRFNCLLSTTMFLVYFCLLNGIRIFPDLSDIAFLSAE